MPCNNMTVKYQSPLLIVNCDYNKTIEGDTYPLTLTFDNKFFNNTPATLSIPTSGMNAKLTLDSNYAMTFPL